MSEENDEENWTTFEKAVRTLYNSWTVVKLVKENVIGDGPTTKIEEILEIFLDNLSSETPPDVDDMIDYFYETFDQTLKVVVEDGSVEQIAELIDQLRSDCLKRNYALAEKILREHNSIDRKVENPPELVPISKLNDNPTKNAMHDELPAAPSTTQNISSEKEEKSEPSEDDWQVVSSKKKRKK